MRIAPILSVVVILFPLALNCHAQSPEVEVRNIRKVFDNGEHNAFTDLTQFQDHYYLTFRSCPDGHMVHPTSSIIVLRSQNLEDWTQVVRFSVPLRDTRDPHFLVFRDQLFVYTGTWYCGETSPEAGEYDLNEHLGYAVFSSDGRQWSEPQMLEGTYGHYIWRANTDGTRAYLCGRRKHQFDQRRRGDAVVESAMLESDDGLTWKTRSLFQEKDGDETAFQFLPDGEALAVSRRGRNAAEVLRADPPYTSWLRNDLPEYLGGPLLASWAHRWIVGGRRNTEEGPRTVLSWLNGNQLTDFAVLPSGGDNSYPGFIALSPTKAIVSWYSSHEVDVSGNPITNIYMADLEVVSPISRREKVSIPSSWDGALQHAIVSVPSGQSTATALKPLVVSLHSWSGNYEQRQFELEQLVEQRGWYCLQPDFRGVNRTPLACGSMAARQDVLDAVDWCLENHAVDPDRVYLTGNSGGGHMTMLMASHAPHRWCAASAFVGISDLESWYWLHEQDQYGEMMRSVFGGPPSLSAEIASDYKQRSPLHFLANASQVALDISAGIHDGHAGSVPVKHSLDAFNQIALANGDARISNDEIAQVSQRNGRLTSPQLGDEGFDEDFGRQHYLRRQTNRARVTLFEGGHEGIASAAMAWFDLHPVRVQAE